MKYVLGLVLVGVLIVAGCDTDKRHTVEVTCTQDQEQEGVADGEGGAVAQGAAVSLCPIVDVEINDCQNHQGSDIELTGFASWPGVTGKIIASNNKKGTHLREITLVEFQLIQEGDIQFEKEPVDDGVGGNPWFWFQMFDANGHAITERVELGRCNEGN